VQIGHRAPAATGVADDRATLAGRARMVGRIAAARGTARWEPIMNVTEVTWLVRVSQTTSGS
jgi:hypothetical protein